MQAVNTARKPQDRKTYQPETADDRPPSRSGAAADAGAGGSCPAAASPFVSRSSGAGEPNSRKDQLGRAVEKHVRPLPSRVVAGPLTKSDTVNVITEGDRRKSRGSQVEMGAVAA